MSHAATIARMDIDTARRNAERLSRYRANPEEYLARRLLAGLPAVPPPGAEPAQVRGRVQTPAVDPEPYPENLPGYRLHLSIDAITEAINEIKAERRRASHNQDARDAIKAAYQHTFWRHGLRLVKIPNWQGMPA